MATHLMGQNYEKALFDHNCDPTKKTVSKYLISFGPQSLTGRQTDRVTDNVVNSS